MIHNPLLMKLLLLLYQDMKFMYIYVMEYNSGTKRYILL